MARRAKQLTVSKQPNAERIVLKRMDRGKYFRIVANVEIDGRDLSRKLIPAGLARPYEGGTRKG